MADQLTIFEEIDRKLAALARATDPATSHAAARTVTPTLQHLHALILAALTGAWTKGLTTHEIAACTDVEWGSITPRMLPMEKLGFVKRSGSRIPPGRTRPSIVWFITDVGRMELSKTW